jgi:hypothetical protein
MRRTRRRSVLAVLAIALGFAIQLGSASVAGADDLLTSGGSRAVPAHRVDGSTGGQLLGQAWEVWYSLPVTEPSPSCMRLGRTGGVLLSARPQPICTLEQGDALILFWSTTCDDVVDPAVDPTFYAPDEASQRKCAAALDKAFVADLRVTVDNGKAVNIRNRRFEVYSPQVHVQLPLANFYGISPRPATFTAHGWVALVKGLKPGLHTTDFEIVFTDGQSDTFTRTVNVVRDHGH